MTPYFLIKKKIDSWKRIATTVAAAREAARKLLVGLDPSPGEWQRLPKYVHPALKALKPECDQPPDGLRRWFQRLVWRFGPTTEVALQDYARCFVLSPSVFTDASLAAALHKFEVFPAPAPLRKFLIDWGEEHRPRRRSDKYRRKGSLDLTDQERLHLRAAMDAARHANGPIKHLPERYVRVARVLELPQRKPPTHQQLADATGSSIRTVRRALLALRANGLLPGMRELSSLKQPKRIPSFRPVMAVIAARTGRTGRSVKTLYRWERDLRALPDRPQ